MEDIIIKLKRAPYERDKDILQLLCYIAGECDSKKERTRYCCGTGVSSKPDEAARQMIKLQNKIGSFCTGLTITELCDMHLKYQTEQGELKPKSIDRRECTIENHISQYSLGRMQLQAVKVSDIDNHIGTLIKDGRLSVSSMEKVK